MQEENQFKVDHYVIEVAKTNLQRPRAHFIYEALDETDRCDKWTHAANY